MLGENFIWNLYHVAGSPAINLSEMDIQPEHRQYFKERPHNLTVVEGESVTLRWSICSI